MVMSYVRYPPCPTTLKYQMATWFQCFTHSLSLSLNSILLQRASQLLKHHWSYLNLTIFPVTKYKKNLNMPPGIPLSVTVAVQRGLYVWSLELNDMIFHFYNLYCYTHTHTNMYHENIINMGPAIPRVRKYLKRVFVPSITVQITITADNHLDHASVIISWIFVPWMEVHPS